MGLKEDANELLLYAYWKARAGSPIVEADFLAEKGWGKGRARDAFHSLVKTEAVERGFSAHFRGILIRILTAKGIHRAVDLVEKQARPKGLKRLLEPVPGMKINWGGQSMEKVPWLAIVIEMVIVAIALFYWGL